MDLSVGCGVGHGGDDPGACAFGYTEAEIILPIVKHVESFLERRGVKGYLTRTANTNSSINSKVALFINVNILMLKNSQINLYNLSNLAFYVFLIVKMLKAVRLTFNSDNGCVMKQSVNDSSSY